jgi:hypothetical protein
VGVLLDVLFGLLLAGCAFYWAVSAYIDVGVFAIRCSGYSSTSAVPGVATITGVVAAAVVREWFGWVETPAVYFWAVAPDAVYQLGVFVLLVRVRVLRWPDRARPGAEPGAAADRGIHSDS